MELFINEVYTLFNEGLEGVNVTGTQTLVHPNQLYAIENRVFNFSQSNVLTLMASYANNINISQVNPQAFLAQNGLTVEQARQHFDEVDLALDLTAIINDYIEAMYQACIQEHDLKVFFSEVNKETPNMGAGKFYLAKQHRPLLTCQTDVKQLIKNLAFCWRVFHANTFTVNPYAEYWSFRPSMLKLAVPDSPQGWEDLKERAELPYPKVMMATSQLVGGVSGKDPDNLLLKVMLRRRMEANSLLK
jgi:hypothetical protein